MLTSCIAAAIMPAIMLSCYQWLSCKRACFQVSITWKQQISCFACCRISMSQVLPQKQWNWTDLPAELAKLSNKITKGGEGREGGCEAKRGFLVIVNAFYLQHLLGPWQEYWKKAIKG